MRRVRKSYALATATRHKQIVCETVILRNPTAFLGAPCRRWRYPNRLGVAVPVLIRTDHRLLHCRENQNPSDGNDAGQQHVLDQVPSVVFTIEAADKATEVRCCAPAP